MTKVAGLTQLCCQLQDSGGSGQAMNDVNKAMAVSHSHSNVGRRGKLSAVPMLLLFSLGFVLGMTSNSKFPNFYLSSVAPSPCPPPPPVPSSSSPPPSPPPLQNQQNPAPQVGLAWFLAPSSSAMHNMTDEELMWWASMAPKGRSSPYHRAPKVAFLFLARGDLPLRPLWEKFFAGHQGLYSIYVHTDPSYTGSPPVDSVFYGRMIPSQKTMWGDVSLVAAERRLLANALLDLGNERFVLLSESCIPLYNFTTVYTVLTGTDTSSVDVIVTPARYNPLFAERNNITAAQWRKGEDWFEMDRALALEVVSDGTYFPTFRERCEVQSGACLMDEHYVPTLLSVLRWPRSANRTLTFTDWKRRANLFHPHAHRGEEVTPELVEEIRGGARAGGVCFLFARKFTPDSLQPLLRLAPKVMGFG